MILLSKYCTVSHYKIRTEMFCKQRYRHLTSVKLVCFDYPTNKLTYCNSFCLVFLLLRSQGELYEQLLELLVAVVNAKLLKTGGRRTEN